MHIFERFSNIASNMFQAHQTAESLAFQENSSYNIGTFNVFTPKGVVLSGQLLQSMRRDCCAMLIKAIYEMPYQRKYLLLMPDDKLYTVRSTISRRLTKDDLKPICTELTNSEYIAEVGAAEIEIKNAKDRGIWIQTLGISKSPLQAARFDAHITQKQLANLSGVSIYDIQAIEEFRAKPGNFIVRTILNLADCLNVDLRYLLQEN